MAKKTAKSSPKPARKPMSPEARRRVRNVILNALGTIAFATIVGVGFIKSRQYVAQIEAPTAPPAVELVGRPSWMSDGLAAELTAMATPKSPSAVTDRTTLVDRALALKANPWIKQVNSVRRAYHEGPGDVIEVDCDYRAPVALVHWNDGYVYVDADGVRLPETLSPAQARAIVSTDKPMFRVIDGVGLPPLAAGKPWPGADVKAGIELVALLAGKPFADQVIKIDITNYAGRERPNESQINLVTKYGTQIRWGQPPSSKDFFAEQKVDRKLQEMQEAIAQTGRLDMNLPWIDLRFDNPTVPDRRASLDTSR